MLRKSAESNKKLCPNCTAIVGRDEVKCPSCGVTFEQIKVPDEKPQSATVNSFSPMYNLYGNKFLETYIETELEKMQYKKDSNLIPPKVLKSKKISALIFSILLYVYIVMIFFHFPLFTYAIGLIILVIVYKSARKFNYIQYLIKEIKSRPSEKISNIIMQFNSNLTIDDSKNYSKKVAVVALVLPLLIFYKPRILYEEKDNGYAVRFYTFGLFNFTKAEIPKVYNDKPVVSLRGNTFSNMPFLKKVILPDTITEIRGQAFKNDFNLTTVNMPNKLEYLGGGSFYNCKSLEKIEFPNTLEYLGGESFYNAKSLKKVKLSEKLTEIRGNTFENCSSLKEIEIPNNVRRIGGHAFYSNSSLTSVKITSKSDLREIGSSAFRRCLSLRTIMVPENTKINERAFKESPTEVKRYDAYFFSAEAYKKYHLGDKKSTYVTIDQNNEQIHVTLLGSKTINDIYLTLLAVKPTDDAFVYVINCSEGTEENIIKQFTFDEDNPIIEITPNLIVRLENKIALKTNNSALHLAIFYH